MQFGVGNVLATTFRVWIRNLPRFVLVALVFHVPLVIWYALLSYEPTNAIIQERFFGAIMRRHPALMGQATGGMWIWMALITGALAACTVPLLHGKRMGIGAGIATALRRTVSLVGAAFVLRLVTVGVLTAYLIIALDRHRYLFASDGWYIVWPLLWVVFTAFTIVVLPVIAVEKRGAFAALRRGWQLGRGNRWRLIAISLLMQVLTFGIQYLVFQLVLGRHTDFDDYGRRFAIFTFTTIGVDLVYATWRGVLAAVTYERLREAKEGPAPATLDDVFA